MTTTQSPSRGAQRWITVLDGNQLRRLRQQRGLSQEQLASQAGISLSAVTRLERQALGSCRCRTLARLAAALGERPAVLTPAGHVSSVGDV
jgi:transcriptional regulator with XRE-family HTH domain